MLFSGTSSIPAADQTLREVAAALVREPAHGRLPQHAPPRAVHSERGANGRPDGGREVATRFHRNFVRLDLVCIEADEVEECKIVTTPLQPRSKSPIFRHFYTPPNVFLFFNVVACFCQCSRFFVGIWMYLVPPLQGWMKTETVSM